MSLKKKNPKIAVVSFGMSDSIIPLLKNISEKGYCEISLFLTYSQTSGLEGIIDIKKDKLNSGIFEKSVIKKMFDNKISDYIDGAYQINIYIFPSLKLKSIDNFKLSFQFAKRLRQYDIIHFNGQHGVLPYLQFLLINHPQIYSIHDYIGHTGERKWFADFMNKFIIFVGKQIIVHNKNTFVEIIKNFPKLKKKINYVPFGILEVYKLFGDENIKERENTILFFGRISPYKGVEYLVEAAKRLKKKLPNFHVIIAGGGKFYFDISDIKNDSTFIIINRYISNDELADLIRQATLVVCPYTDATQSGVVMTAFAFNKPVIASNVGGFKDVIVDNKTGKLVPPKNSDKLGKTIFETLQDKKKLEDMKENISVLKQSREFSWSEIAEKTVDIYRRSIDT